MNDGPHHGKGRPKIILQARASAHRGEAHFKGMDESLTVSKIIEQKILLLRGQKVMLDFHLAELYGVETKTLKRAVKRNIDRFPEDFMFALNTEEYTALRYQFGALKRGGHAKYLPYAFTEQGVAMLSSVLHSKRAVQVNIEIMRAFVHLRELLSTHKDLARKLEELEKKYDEQFAVVFRALRELMTPPEPPPKRRIGFHVAEPKSKYRTSRARKK